MFVYICDIQIHILTPLTGYSINAWSPFKLKLSGEISGLFNDEVQFLKNKLGSMQRFWRFLNNKKSLWS